MKEPLLQTSRLVVLASLFLVRSVEAQLPWSTFLGGNNEDRTYSVARDSSGFVYVAGHTASTNFPAVTPSVYTYLPPGPGPTGFNLFICKLNPAGVSGAQLVWSTIIGGSGNDEAFDLALDPAGNVVVTGHTTSSNFPVTSAYDSTANGIGDAFVLMLSPNGTTLVYSTFLGGSDNDFALEIAAGPTGILTLAGCTLSADLPTSNPYRATLGGGRDVFVARIDPALGPSGLLYCTYLGGSGNDGRALPNPVTGLPKSLGLHVDTLGVVTVAGPTTSTDFPTSPGAFQGALAGSWDAFVSVLDPALPPAAQLTYSTYLGGPSEDAALTVDRIGQDRLVLGGYTYSALPLQFPVTAGAYGTTFNGSQGVDNDMFLTVLEPSQPGSAQLIYSTFIGGTANEMMNTLCTDPSGAVVFGGFTASPGFPTTNGALPPIAPPSGANPMGVVGRLNPVGTGLCDLEYSTFLGGPSSTAQEVTTIALDSNLGVHVAGMTVSTSFPTSMGAFLPNYGGGPRDAWTARLDLLPAGNVGGAGGPFFGAIRYAPSANAGGPVMLVGDGPVPGSSCFSVICRRAPARASGFLGLTYDVASVNTALTAPFFVGVAPVWLNPAHQTFTLIPVGLSSLLGGCVVPFPLTGLPVSLGLQVIAQFGWFPVTGPLQTSDVLRIYI